MVRGREPEEPEGDEFMREFGARVRQLRDERGITQRELATIAGVSPGFIYLIESGKQNPSLTLIRKLAAGLHMSLEDLVAGSEVGEEPTERSVGQLSRAVERLLERIDMFNALAIEVKAEQQRLLKAHEHLLDYLERRAARGKVIKK